MAFRRPQVTVRPRTRALVASGQQIDLNDREQLAAFKRRSAKLWWQERAAYYDNEVPLLGFAHDYVRDSMSRVMPFPAIIGDDPHEPPMPLDDENTPPGLDPELCRQILDRLAPFPDFMGSAARKVDVAGECHVALIADPDEIDGERCEVFSTDELFIKGDEYFYREDASDSQGTKLPADSTLFRIWQPDPQFRMQPTSHMRRLVDTADTLLLLMRVIRGISRSRLVMAERILGIAEELSLESATRDGQAPTEDAGDGEARSDTFIEDFLTAAETAISDPESAASVLPLIVRGPMHLLKDGIVDISLERKFDETLIKIRQELREELANGVNLPREILLGIGATNHWNAEEIKTQTWQAHLEPRAMGITAATTVAFYRPQLLENGVDPEIVRRCVVGYDPSWYIGSPDLSDQADAAHEKFIISDDYYRQIKGMPPDAAPTIEEVNRRIWIHQQERVTIREDASGDTIGDLIGDPSAKIDESEVTVNEPPPPEVTPTAPIDKTAPPPVVAAAAPSAVDRLGPKLVGIERDLRTRLHQAANQVVTAALERAGMKVRAKVRNKRTVLAQLADVPAIEIPAALGQVTVRSLGLQDQDLIAGALAGLSQQFHQQVRRAQHAAGRAAAQASGREFDEDRFDEALGSDRDDGWTVLEAGLGGLMLGMLYDPHPAAPEVGEFDDTSIVPLGLVRAALDRAGGARVGAPDQRHIPAPGKPQGTSPNGGGATAGPSVLSEFSDQLALQVGHFEWVYGDAPRREFLPHLDLDGIEFAGWDDPILANAEEWPDTEYFAPADHDGCQCDFAVVFEAAEADEAAA